MTTTTTETTTILTTVAEALYRQAGYVPFLWHIDDVREVNEDRETPFALTDAECLAILINARDNVSADTGMSLGIVEIELEFLAENHEGGPDLTGAVCGKLDAFSVALAHLAAEAAALLAEMQGEGMSGRVDRGAKCPRIIGGQP